MFLWLTSIEISYLANLGFKSWSVWLGCICNWDINISSLFMKTCRGDFLCSNEDKNLELNEVCLYCREEV